LLGLTLTTRAYHEFDSVPAHINPLFYDALDEWGFDGFVMADDTGASYIYILILQMLIIT